MWTQVMPRMAKKQIAPLILLLLCAWCGPVPGALAAPADHHAPAEAHAPANIGKAIPSDVFLFVQAQANPERQFLNDHFEEVWQAFLDSGIIETVRDILNENIPESDKAEFTMVMDTIKRFGSMVDWYSLIENECVFGMRMEFPTPGYMFVTRPHPDKYKAALDGLKSVLAEVQKFEAETFQLETAQREKAEITALSFGPHVPVELCVAGVDGAIMITTSAADVRKCVDLYSGKVTGSLIDHAWFKEGVSKLPAFEDSLTFFNMESLLDGYVTMLDNVLKMNGGGADNERQAILDVVKEAVSQFRMLQYFTAVETTNKNMTVTETYTKMAPGAPSLPLYQAFANQETFTDFHKHIPKDVTSFSLNSGVDLSALYRWASDFVKKKVPEGDKLIAKWDGMQSQWGINIHDDILSWISGESISFSLPAATSGGMGMGMGMGGEFAWLIKVEDAEKGRKTVERGLNAVSELAKQFGQTLIIAPAADAGEHFKSIMFPMMPIVKPVIGFEGDYMVIASSGKALAAMRKVRAGEAPSVLENPKFAALGINPKGEVGSISFQDQSATYEELAQAMAMIPMFAGMALQGNEPEKKIARDLVNVLPLLSPVIQKLNFHLATSSYTVYDGKDGAYTKVVNSYKKEEDA